MSENNPDPTNENQEDSEEALASRGSRRHESRVARDAAEQQASADATAETARIHSSVFHPFSADAFIRTAGKRSTRIGDYDITWRTATLAIIAIPIGIVSAIVSWLLQMLIGLISNAVFYGRFSTELVSPGFHPHPWWLILGAPIVGGLIIGVMARYGSEKIRGHGMPETMEAILVNHSIVKPRVAFFKPVSAAVSIGTGGPFGAEGPIIMTGGAIGSTLAQLLRLTSNERKTLLVAGGAAGMAATFNTSLAAVLLAVEILLFEFRPRSLIPVSAAVATAAIARGPLMGYGPKLPIDNSLIHHSLTADLGALVIGVGGVVIAVLSVILVYRSDDAFHLLPIHWMWWPALGGLIIGIGGLFQPRALGVGYDVIGDLLHGKGTATFIISLLVVKLLIWALSLGSGTSGSVLAPTFLIGSAMGAACGLFLPDVAPGFWALLGLAAVTGGSLRAPLTGIVFTLELTHGWNAMVPLMIASLSAYCLSSLILRRSILTEQLARRGMHLSMEYTVDPMESAFVGQIMTPLGEYRYRPLPEADENDPLPMNTSLNGAMERFLYRHEKACYVADSDDGKLVGILTLDDVLSVRRHAIDDDRIRVRNLSPRRFVQAQRATTRDRRIEQEDARRQQRWG